MDDGRVHGQPLRQCMLARNDHVHIVAAAQAMIDDGEEAIGVRRQIDAHDVGFLVNDVVEETGDPDA